MVSTAVWIVVPVSETVYTEREAVFGRKIISFDLDMLKLKFVQHLKLQQNSRLQTLIWAVIRLHFGKTRKSDKKGVPRIKSSGTPTFKSQEKDEVN